MLDRDGTVRLRAVGGRAGRFRRGTRSTWTARRSTFRWPRSSSPRPTASTCRWASRLALLGVLMITSKGAAGVTGSGFIVLASTLSALRIVPVEGVALVLGVDRFMSEARAITNLIGNAVATVVIAKSEGAFAPEGLSPRTDLRGAVARHRLERLADSPSRRIDPPTLIGHSAGRHRRARLRAAFRADPGVAGGASDLTGRYAARRDSLAGAAWRRGRRGLRGAARRPAWTVRCSCPLFAGSPASSSRTRRWCWCCAGGHAGTLFTQPRDPRRALYDGFPPDSAAVARSPAWRPVDRGAGAAARLAGVHRADVLYAARLRRQRLRRERLAHPRRGVHARARGAASRPQGAGRPPRRRTVSAPARVQPSWPCCGARST